MFSTLLLYTIGYSKAVTLIFSMYSIRLLGYSKISEAYHCYLLEMMKPFCHNLALIAGSHFIRTNTMDTNIGTLEVHANNIDRRKGLIRGSKLISVDLQQK